MAYVKETAICGKVVEIKKYYSARYHSRDNIARAPKSEKTKEIQERINLKRSVERLRRLINTNFRAGDLHVTLTYGSSFAPASFEDAKSNMVKFLRRLKREVKKDGVELKFIYVNGVGRRSYHHHLVISRAALPYIEKHGSFGRLKIALLDKGGDYSNLAAYLAKHFEKSAAAGEGKKFHQSRSLAAPIIRKTVVKANEFLKIPKEKKGFYVDKNSIEMGVCEFSGYPYISYRMVCRE